jgi:hypothetical protein
MTRRLVTLQLVEYMKKLVAGARGNVVSISLRSASKALGAESRAEAAAVKAVLDALASLGLLEAAGGNKPRYVLRRGSPLWVALEAGRAEQVAELASAAASRCLKPKRRKRR